MSFRLGQFVYDLTVRFCDLYIPPRSRTHDQMVQAARGGVQNIAEGSVASATSKKMELKLTQVARASLEELRLDYEDYLRQRGEPLWTPDHPALQRFKAKRCTSLEEIRNWIQEERLREKAEGSASKNTTKGEEQGQNKEGTRTDKRETRTDKDEQGRGKEETKNRFGTKSVSGQCSSVSSPCQSVSPSVSSPGSLKAPPSSVYAANAALSLLNLCCYFLDRQVAAQAASFEKEGGFTERLYKTRQARRRQS